MPQNLTRSGTFNQKRSLSVAYFEPIDYTDLTAEGGTGSIMAVIPAHSTLIHIGVIELEAANVGAQATITIGADTLVTNGPIDANGLFTLAPQHSDLAGDLIIKQGATPPSQGVFEFFFVYCEHEKHNGEYTNFSAN